MDMWAFYSETVFISNAMTLACMVYVYVTYKLLKESFMRDNRYLLLDKNGIQKNRGPFNKMSIEEPLKSFLQPGKEGEKVVT